MRLNHANLVTGDVAALADFLIRHFDFEQLVMRGRSAFAVLRGTDGFDLNLMKPGKDGTADYPDGWHIGFVVASAAEVMAKHAELEKAGARPGAMQRLTRGGVSTTPSIVAHPATCWSRSAPPPPERKTPGPRSGGLDCE